MRKVNNILSKIEVLQIIGDANVLISAIEFDSRKIETSQLFVAVKGYQADGHKFIEMAIDKGAVAIVCEDLPVNIQANITYLQVENSAYALGQMASNFYDNPSDNLKLVGVTGTNGKTTTVTLLYQLFKKLGYKVGLLSTICNYIDISIVDATHTTPDPVQLNKLLAEMVEVGCEFCFMEVSSHALHQQRVAGLNFKGAVFTNITQDHLDYHKTFAAYIKAKKLFFDALAKDAFSLVNVDDKNGRIMLQNTESVQHTLALKNMANFKGRILESHIDGMLISFDNTELWTQFIGGFNAYNLLSVYAVAVLLNQNRDEVFQALSTLVTVDGRFEYMKSKSGKLAIVDYAHTPDALKNVLITINEISEGNHKIISVVGAGGNRDKAKRPIMAKVAAELSNQVILTSDNPRNEKPEDVIEEMRAGVLPPLNSKLLAITNRKEAIKTACMLAQAGDIVLVAGKGHETYQEINGVKNHFDDKEVINEIFENE
ncbi:MAG: UDP-N-acetylmuramoyl-L-alanyl-D-glutamate--2,6-diaminopimelate ligase [Salinivirgaceae bacterium]|nr:UDP-N-acetylmuramoyl-L-alanyl-D-glutamate--2,6-diaminopimelate ligase [Salinivirgaceae bacterium]